jgi:16S rRNA (cytidine1402-2'-O)-methyltransferase
MNGRAVHALRISCDRQFTTQKNGLSILWCASLRQAKLCYNSLVGNLYLVATPIGNLEDISQRALRILNEVALIAAEDTRRTKVLLSHYQITTPMVSYFEHNKLARIHEILSTLSQADVALVSDAGTPGVSDPGFELVHAVLDKGHEVSPIPGPSALIAALIASGLPAHEFAFYGFLPRTSNGRKRALQKLLDDPRTHIYFESPHRLNDSLADIESVLGKQRAVAVCREMTKMNEEFIRGEVATVRKKMADQMPRGEITSVRRSSPD